MRTIALSVLLIATLATAVFALADFDACANEDLWPAHRALACTTVINVGGLPGERLAQAYNHRGNAHFEARAYALAIASYSRAVEAKPSYAAPFYNRALARCQYTRCLRGALEDTNRAIALAPDAKALTLRGLIHWREHRPKEALHDLTRAISLKPDHAEAYSKRAIVRDETGDPGGALQDYQRLVELTPDSADAHYDFANALREVGLTNEALREYAIAISLKPGFHEAYHNRALIRRDQKEYARAIEDLNRALQIAKFTFGYLNRAHVYAELGRFEEALADYDTAIHLHPSGSNYAWRGRMLMKWSPAHFDRAQRDFDAAVQADPSFVWAYLWRAMLHYRRDAHARALQDLERARAPDLTPTEIDYMLGLVLKATGRTTEGQAAIDSARLMMPDIDNRIEDYGVARDQSTAVMTASAPVVAHDADARRCADKNQSDFALEIADCSAAIRTTANTAALAHAHLRRAKAYMATGKVAEARLDFEKVIQLAPNEPAAFAGRAETRLRLANDFIGAASDYTRAAALKPADLSIMARMCFAQAVARRNLDEALRSCERGLEADPGAPHLLGARGLVRLLRGEYAMAVADYDAALATTLPGMPGDPYALFGRAIAKARRNDSAGARDDRTAALAIEPGIAGEFKTWGLTP